MNGPILSFCIPTFNRASCLKQCLASIVEQFKDSSIFKSVEIVVSDNNSPDDTESVVKDFQNTYSNIYYYKNSENIGVDRNILNVVEKANGEFVWFLGDDDALFPNSIEYILKELNKKNTCFSLVNCLGYDHELISPSVKQPNFSIESNQYFETLHDAIFKINKKSLVGYFCGLSTQVFKRSLWQSFTKKQNFLDTNIVHLHILLSVMKNQKFSLVAKPLVKVRASNIRWETFPGLETLRKRALSTSKALQWILDEYKVPYSKISLKIEYYQYLTTSWVIGTLKKFVFKNQKSRDFIKKIFNKI